MHKLADGLISIHALLAESDGQLVARLVHVGLFLSTLSLRRATCTSSSWAFKLANFYPRSPCGERRCKQPSSSLDIHFYPRSPCGERHVPRAYTAESLIISIHALLAESDVLCGGLWKGEFNFYPRSPCGERRHHGLLWPSRVGFLSTLSLRRATAKHTRLTTKISDFYPRSPCGERRQAQSLKVAALSISIHALLAESDAFTLSAV